MHYYLYEIRNNLNGKIYVGVHKTANLDDGYMGSGTVIKSAIKKHGVDNFAKVILETFVSSEEMYARELEIVTDEFISRCDVYNLRRGGHGGFDHINSLPSDSDVKLRRQATLQKMAAEGKLGGDMSMHFTADSYDRIRAGSKRGNDKIRITDDVVKEKWYKKIADKSTGDGNSQFGTKFYVHVVTGDRKRFKDPPTSSEWIPSLEYNENQKLNSRRWYNDGSHNFFIYMDDMRIASMMLVKGRIKTA